MKFTFFLSTLPIISFKSVSGRRVPPLLAVFDTDSQYPEPWDVASQCGNKPAAELLVRSSVPSSYLQGLQVFHSFDYQGCCVITQSVPVHIQKGKVRQPANKLHGTIANQITSDVQTLE